MRRTLPDFSPGAVPLLLQDGGQLGAGAHGPLEFVEGDDELAVRGPAADDGVEGRAPVVGGEAGQEGLVQERGGLAQELAICMPAGACLPRK